MKRDRTKEELYKEWYKRQWKLDIKFKVLYIHIRETRELNSRRLENLQRKLHEQKRIYESHNVNNNSSYKKQFIEISPPVSFYFQYSLMSILYADRTETESKI